jgi:hypothetical protein
VIWPRLSPAPSLLYAAGAVLPVVVDRALSITSLLLCCCCPHVNSIVTVLGLFTSLTVAVKLRKGNIDAHFASARYPDMLLVL